MGGMHSAIEQEEKELRMKEEQNEILELITYIQDIKSEQGVEQLEALTKRFERTFEVHEDDEDGVSDQNHVYTKLPWDGMVEEEQKEIQTYAARLAEDENLLIQLPVHREYHFDFSMDKYIFLAVVISRYIKKIDETRVALVPDEVSEKEFWSNYFYELELWKHQRDIPNKLGEAMREDEREEARQEIVKKAEKEIEQLKSANPDILDEASQATDASSNQEGVSQEGIEMTNV